MTFLIFGFGMTPPAFSQKAAPQTAPETWRLALVGDLMLGTTYPQPDVPPDQGRRLMQAALPVLRAADWRLGNFEGTFGTGGVSSKRGCARCFAFRSPPALVQALQDAGFQAVSLANNHSHDFGPAGLLETETVLTRAHIAFAGPLELPWAHWRTPDGRTMCLLAFAPNVGSHDLRNIPAAAADVRRARQACTLVLVTFHGGAEGPQQTHTPMGVQRYLGENRGDVRAFAHAMVDAGADLVFGQGPHVVRGMELRHGHLIAYSLGNFITYGGISVRGVEGWSVVLSVTLDAQGRLVAGQAHSFLQTPHGPLRIDPDAQVSRLMAQRTQEDFQGGGLVFGSQGTFQPSTP